MIHLVKEIIEVNPFSIVLRFNTGDVLKVDLEKELKEWSSSPNSRFIELTDPKTFKGVKLDKEMESIYWENGLDLCPDVLYEIGKRSKRSTRRDT